MSSEHDEGVGAHDGVWARREPVVLPTYEPGEPGIYPAFLNQRVYQGGSGRVYPMPFIESIAPQSHDRAWDAVHLENRWLQVTILPELGGRLIAGYDKARDHDFFYRNTVIKPALVGLAGPWISGGVEFNWPQHHRPATYLPVACEIEESEDGSVTVWCSDHDPMQRMRGLHGIRMHPDRSWLEVVVRLSNRTEMTQTFLWWANVAAEVNDDYQSIFPPDVSYVADHANRATTSFPEARGHYYGVDYPARRTPEHPDGDRLDWYRNIPVPTSYMVLRTNEEFFGGYDHARQAGFVHWAPREVSPGKKQWTWGDAEFGHAWDRNLSDDGRPYVELMAGVYTNNQPDFTFLAPGETKTFTQLWYPYGRLGTLQQATPEAALHLTADQGQVRVGAVVTRPHASAHLVLWRGDQLVHEWALNDLTPADDVVHTLRLTDPSGLRLELRDAQGRLLAAAAMEAEEGTEQVPPPAREPDQPSDIASNDELYLIGVHLEQYRHATRSPEPYWREALARDPGDGRCNTALGARYYRKGAYDQAEALLRTAVDRSNMLNLNPRNGEPHYLLGLTLVRLGRLDQARPLLARSAWDGHWAGPAEAMLARLAIRAGDPAAARDHAERSLAAAANSLPTQVVQALAMRALGQDEAATTVLETSLCRDRLDAWTTHALSGALIAPEPGVGVDVAMEYRSIGAWDQALAVLAQTEHLGPVAGATNQTPLIAYHTAWLEQARGGDPDPALSKAKTCDARWCVPVRLDDVDVLRWALEHDPQDALANELLGDWNYHHDLVDLAREHWRRAEQIRPNPVVLRNLAIDAYNNLRDPQAAAHYYHRARELAPDDAKLLSETDQLAERMSVRPHERLQLLEHRLDLVEQRDDLCLALARLLLLTNQPERARSFLAGREFQPWEGGEGQALAAWEAACILTALTRPVQAVQLVGSGLQSPATLGEARHPLANPAHLWLAHGDALARAGDLDAARNAWTIAAEAVGDFQDMAVTSVSEATYFSVLAARRLGRDELARELVASIQSWIEQNATATPRIDFFATSLPELLLFQQGLEDRRDDKIATLRAQLELLDGQPDGPAMHQARRRTPHSLPLLLSAALRTGR